ncbi:MFS transporter [Mitsuaria sp. 7]|uniref:MFS transporter n=1 Tax=Mitsuaria sp. 7 TaxID=1658665 RepID=UPI0007DD1AA6|nr:MFS transporter [Mitsuaria sp. 7]ANH68252.1 membrane protein [Mitsuaria sp. 7]
MPLARAGTTAALGVAQTLAWASTYYLPAMLAAPMAIDLGVSTSTVFGAFSMALVVSACVGPAAGRAIDRHGGRPVLMISSLVFFAGLALLGSARSTAGMVAAWIVLGVGMGGGLYEAAFAALVRLWGQDSRAAITGVTLLAGFASTVGWPLTSHLETTLGWRSTCFVWAALHLCLGLPLNALIAGVEKPLSAIGAPPMDVIAHVAASKPSRYTTALLAWVFAATLFISTAMAAHLPRLLQAQGASLEGAVMVGALIGPAQVAARLTEFGLMRHLHPLIAARLAAALHPFGAILLGVLGAPAAAVFGLLHGAGNGILTIAKGTLPLSIFGAQGYGRRQGVLMIPARLAQAIAPWSFGLALDASGRGALAISGAIGALAFASLFALTPPAPEKSLRGIKP